MSIADCLKKHGIDTKHEDVILKGFAQAVDDGQLDNHAEATSALQEALIDAENERADIMAQIAPKTDSKGKLLNTNFTKWFGDSMVVDEQGRALVVYHGTSQDISVFNPDKAKGKTFGTGSFFSSNPLTSATYTKGANGGNIMPVYLSMRTPAVLDAQGANWNRINKTTRVTLPAIDGKKSRNTTLGRLLPDDFKYVDDYGSTDDIARWARQQGYDGLIINNVKDQGPTGNFVTEESGAPGTIYVVYKANQVKSAIGNKGQFSKSNDDIRFSKSEVERTLIAQHNLSVSNLIHADRMGALAAPSIAITDKAHPLTGFGEITLLADEDFVNGARTFGADIYSTRYPEVSYDFSIKDIKKLNELFQAEKSRLGEHEFYASNMDDPKRIMKESPAVAVKFLESEGIKPRIKLITPSEKPGAHMLKWVKSPLDRQELTRDPKFIEDVKKEYIAKFKDVPVDEMDGILPENDDQWRNVAYRQAFTVTNYRDSLKDKGKVDLDETGRTLIDQIRLNKRMDKFNAYIDSVITEINPKQEIFDKLTNTGNGRKYIEHNLDNVIRKMRSSFVGGESFGFGLGKIRGVHAPEFKSIEQIRKNKHRLMSDKEFDAVKKDVGAELTQLTEKVNQYGTYSGYDNVEQAIFDSAKMGVSRALTYNGFKNVPDDVKSEIETFIEKLRNMPTEYFEAKVLRGVKLGEFKAAIVPKDIPQEALDILKKNGIEDIRKYKSGDNADRIKQINKVTHVMFSRAPKLYSKLEQALEAANDKVFSTGPQVKLWLQSNAGKLGIKKDEIYWSGIDNWLDAQGKVSKQQVVEFVRNNGVKVEDVTLGDDKEFNTIRDRLDRMLLDELEDRPVDKTEQAALEKRLREIKNTEPKHNNDKLTLPGGTDYKELVVTVPTIKPHNADDSTHFGDTGGGRQIGWIRMDTRDGGLFIEELQSQRAQQGRSKGFQREVNQWFIAYKDGPTLGDSFSSEQEARAELVDTFGKRDDMEIRPGERDRSTKMIGVPPAPFVSDANNKATNAYITLLMKKALIEAVSNDHTSVSWTTGDQQILRYFPDEFDNPAVRIWNEVTKPESGREEMLKYFGSELASMIPLKIVDTPMLLSLKNDEIREQVVKSIPVDVVNILSDNGISTDKFVSNPNVVSDTLPVEVRPAVARGLAHSLMLVGTRLRAALNRVFPLESTRGEQKLYATIRTSDLDTRTMARLLSTPSVDGRDEAFGDYSLNSRTSASGSAGYGTESTVSSPTLTRESPKLSIAELAKSLNWHINLLKKLNITDSITGSTEDASINKIRPPGHEWAQSMYGNEQGLNTQGKPSLMSQAANDIFKHLGSGKVESINGQPGFYVTPEMKSKDLPLFSRSTVTVDGIERPTTNSEGKAINNPVNFWKWFGNSEARQWPTSSRGDRAMAPPLVFYHGTKGDFNEFVVGSPGTNSTVFGPWETKRAGMFFTQDKKFAESFATQGESEQGANIIPVYLNVENAIDLTSGFTDDAIIDALAEKGVNPRLMRNISADQIWGMFDEEDDGSFFVSKLKELGYDGAIIVEPNTATGESAESWVVFSPNQIKSATGNNGDYSKTNNDIRFSFAGPKAATADKYALTTAQQRLAAGEDADKVRQATGWFKGVDDKWRFEINDSDASIKKPFPTKGQRFGDVHKSVYESKLKNGYPGISLGDILDHPKLFAAYPNLVDLSVDTQKGDGASFRVSTSLSPSMIQVGEDVPMSDVLSTLLHEVQHGIQRTEGFATGGSVESARRAAADIITTKLKKINERIIDLGTNRSALKGDEYLRNVELHKSLVKERDALNDELEGLKYDMAPAADAYKRLAGEVEARNTQLRMGMSEAERTASSPKDTQDVPDSDQIIVYNGVEMRSEPVPTITVDGIERPTENSEGKSIYNPVNFWRWFGDSKVVDKQGRPLVVYRGDSPDKNEFTGKGKGIRLSGNIFFTDNKSIGNSYAKDRELYSVYLKVIDPYTVDAKYESWLEIPAPREIKEEWGNPDKTIQIDELAAWSRNKGSDGLIVKNVIDQYGDGTQYVVFNPNQIKSATGNNGDYSSTNNDIRFSKEPERFGLVGARKENVQTPPTETRFRKFQRMNQDSFNRFTVIREWLEKNGQKLSDMADVYGAEERYHSKVANQLEDFREQQRNPLIEKIQKAGYTLGDIEVFLKMQHAQEANEAIRKLGGDTAYGVTDEEAAEYLAESPKELATLANELRDITEQTKQLRLDAGILNTDITGAWENTYKHYIPVKGDADEKRGVGKGLKVNFKSKRRLGHSLRDEHVIENILMDHERAIMEVEKNRVGKHLVMMAAEMQMSNIISIAEPEKRKVLKTDTAYTVEANGVVQGVFASQSEAKTFKQLYATTYPNVAPSAIVISQTKDQRVIATASPMLAENEINVYMNGHAIRVQINDELLARAYTKLGVEQFSDIVAAGRILNSYLSKVYTGYNPEFILTNMQRDFTSGAINLTGEQGFVMATKAITNYPRMFGDLLKYAATNGKSSTEWIDSYRANGGNTGAAYLSDMERLGNEVSAEYASYQGVLSNLKQGDTVNAARAAGRKAFNLSLKWIYNLNQAGENAMRLAAYKSMIDSGRTVNEAAKVAKNITVNFNRKGERQSLPALYLFYNATIQGTAAVAHALTKGKHKHQAQALAAGMVGLGYLAASGLGGGSEDDWDKINEYTKERNLLIKSDEGYFKLPVPYGYGFFYNLGRYISEAQRTGELGALPWHLATSALSEFTPLNDTVIGSDEEFNSDQVFMGLLPTAMKIPAQPIFNKQLFTGSELMPDSPFYKSQPDREKMFRGTKGTMYDTVAGWLEAAGMDVSPETLKYAVRTGTGGAGSLVDTAISAAMLKKEGTELDTAEIPFMRKAYMELSIKDTRAAFHKAAGEARISAEQFNAIKRKNDIAKLDTFLADGRNLELLALDDYANKLRKWTTAERDVQDAIKSDENISVKEKRLKLKELEAQEGKYYDDYLDVFKASKR